LIEKGRLEWQYVEKMQYARPAGVGNHTQSLANTLHMLKKTYLLLPLLAIVLSAGSCSEIPENNDPVIGVWARTETADAPEGKTVLREEWIFNDAYLGRYHRYRGEIIELRSDFSWKVEQDRYTIAYPGLDREPDQVIIETSSPGPALLKTDRGEVLAHKE
jgi:hypothetical protein